MRYELYVDSLFLMNFVMNLYILILVNRSTLRTATPGRLLAGAIVGGGGYLLPFIIGGPIPFRLLLGAATALGMLPISFPIKGLKNFMKLVRLIWIKKTSFFKIIEQIRITVGDMAKCVYWVLSIFDLVKNT